MNLISNWDKIQKRYDEFWALENHDRPLLFVTAPKNTVNTQKPPPLKEDISERWLDFETSVARARFHMENTYYAAEAFPSYYPNLGPDIFGAVLGANITFGESTSWADRCVDDWAEFNTFTLDRSNKWYKLITEFTDLVVSDSRGDYTVGFTDMHGGPDAMVSLRGSEKLCADLYDFPELVNDIPVKLWPVLKDFYLELVQRTEKNMTGTSSWMPCWHKGRWYITSCDFICLISPEMFDSFVLPELILETEYFDANIFHLDGPGALRHLDKLLALPRLNGIQWVPGAGAAPVSEWKDILVKIQNAGKVLHLGIGPQELEYLSEYLKPEGVMICTWLNSPEEADRFIKRAEELW